MNTGLIRWLAQRFGEAVMLFGVGVIMILPAAVAYDAFRFHRVREHVNAILQELSPSERAPTEGVKTAFQFSKLKPSAIYLLSSCRLYNALYRNRDYPGFDERMEIWLGWPPLLRAYYSEEEMFGVYLHVAGWSIVGPGASNISRAAFGKDLNELSPIELDCLATFFRRGRSRVCTELKRILPKPP